MNGKKIWKWSSIWKNWGIYFGPDYSEIQKTVAIYTQINQQNYSCPYSS